MNPENAELVLRQVLVRLDHIMKENLLLRDTIASLLPERATKKKRVAIPTREELRAMGRKKC